MNPVKRARVLCQAMSSPRQGELYGRVFAPVVVGLPDCCDGQSGSGQTRFGGASCAITIVIAVFRSS